MKTTKKVKIPAKEVEVTEYVYCDLCTSPKINGWWISSSIENNICDTGISMTEGYTSGDSGCHTVTSFDICAVCFVEKLVPWLMEQGARPTKEEVDW